MTSLNLVFDERLNFLLLAQLIVNHEHCDLKTKQLSTNYILQK